MKRIFFLLCCSATLHAASPVQLERIKIEYRTLTTDPVNNEAAIRKLFAQARKSSAGTAWAAGQEKDFEQKLQEGRRKLGMQSGARLPAPGPRVQPSAVEPIRRVAPAIEQSQLISPSAGEIFNKLNRFLDAQSNTARWSKGADDELHRLRYAAAQHADLNEFVTVYIDDYQRLPAGKVRNELVRLMQEAERLSMTDLMGNRKRIIDLAAAIEKLGAAKTAQLIRANLPTVPQAPRPQEEKKKREAEVKRKEAISDEQRKKATEELRNLFGGEKYYKSRGDLFQYLSDNKSLIKNLIEQGADINAPLPQLQLEGYDFILRYKKVARGIAIGYHFYIEPTLLMLAAYAQDKKLVEQLLAYKASATKSVEVQNYRTLGVPEQYRKLYYYAPLSLAIIGSADRGADLAVTVEIIKLLCAAGADVNAPVVEGKTILMEAAIRESIPAITIKALLDCGADPLIKDDQDKDSFAWLNQSSRSRNDDEEILKLLQNKVDEINELRKLVKIPVEDYPMVGTHDLGGKPLFIPKEKGIRSIILEYLIGEKPKEEEQKQGAPRPPGPVGLEEQMSDVD